MLTATSKGIIPQRGLAYRTQRRRIAIVPAKSYSKALARVAALRAQRHTRGMLQGYFTYGLVETA